MEEVFCSLEPSSLALYSHPALAGVLWAPQVALTVEQSVATFRMAKQC